jgi:DNA-binding CsgD family transcriptional regulator
MVGRDRELELLSELVTGAADRGGAILVWGEPGIGKSTLLNAASDVAEAVDRMLLRTTGVEAETLMPYAGLHQMLRPALGSIGRISERQRAALLTAFGIEDGPAPDPFLVSHATLNLLAELAAERPVIVVADDVQWLDQHTHDTLAFVARRVSGDPIVIIGAMRRGHDGPFASAGLRELDLGGLEETASTLLLAATAPELDAADRERILREALGNPLALVELPAAWRTASTQSIEREPELVPLTSRLERAFAGRIAELPPPARDLVLVAAIDVDNQLSEILAAASVLAGEPVDVAALDLAARADLVRLDGFRVHFRHPLVRSAVLHAESMTRRMSAHAALARVLVDDPYRRTWHRAQAIVGPDDDVADELADSHAISLARGSVISAVWALERSAQLSSDPAMRSRRLMIAAKHAFALGRADIVGRLLAEASSNPVSNLDRARMEWLREIFDEGHSGDPSRVFELCRSAQEAAHAGDPDLALNLLLSAGLRCWWADTGPEARACVAEVTEGLVGFETDARAIAVLAVAEPVLRGSVVLERLDSVVTDGVTDADVLRLLGMAAAGVGDQARAAELFGRVEIRLRAEGRVSLLAQDLAMACTSCLDTGDWERSRISLEEVARLAAETGQPVWTALGVVTDARACALRGDTDRALRLAAEVESASGVGKMNDILACAQLARGVAWCSRGNYSQALDELRRTFDPDDGAFHLRARFCGVMFLAEAAMHSNRIDEVRPIMDDLEQVATITSSPLLHAQMHYARAVLAGDDDAEALYRAGLAADLAQWSWVRSRLQLAYGSWLRRQRRVAESRSPLRDALRTFEAIGAVAWAEQARVELRAAGERVAVRTSSAPDLLTAQELQIARLAAEGMSNREIGERLFLSPRTISTHLYRIFPKLEITSRGQLATRLTNV